MALHHCCIESSPPKNPTLKAGSLLYTSAPRKKQRMRLKFGIIHISMDNFLDKCISEIYMQYVFEFACMFLSLSMYMYMGAEQTHGRLGHLFIHPPSVGCSSTFPNITPERDCLINNPISLALILQLQECSWRDVHT